MRIFDQPVMGRRRAAVITVLGGLGAITLLGSLVLPWCSLHSYFRTDDTISTYDALPWNAGPSLHDRLPVAGMVFEISIAVAGMVALVAVLAGDAMGHRSRWIAATVAAGGTVAVITIAIAIAAALHTADASSYGGEVLKVDPSVMYGVVIAGLSALAVASAGFLDMRSQRAAPTKIDHQ